MTGAVCIMIGGAPRLSVSITPLTLFSSSPTVPIISDVATAIVTGEAGPVSYLWSRVSGDTRITANNPNDSSTDFIASLITPGEIIVAHFQVHVTDTLTGFSATSPDLVQVSLERSL